MPRNGSGVMSKPAGTTAVANTTIESAKFNAVVDDIIQDLNDARPVSAGGTGAGVPADARSNLSVYSKTEVNTLVAGETLKYATKAANYTALAADNATFMRFTAAATLSLTAAATLAAGWWMVVVADGADITVDPNASETIDGATTLLVRNGSSALIICDGTAFFTDKGRAPVAQPFVDVASAGTTNIGAASSANVRITGTTTITSFGTAPAGTLRRLRFAGALTLTYNATSLNLPKNANIVTSADDTCVAISLGGGNWLVGEYNFNDANDERAKLGLGGLATLDITDLVYSGSSTSNLNFPIGTVLFVYRAGGPFLGRNESGAVYRYDLSTEFFRRVSADGTALSGTWNMRGSDEGGTSAMLMMERTL